MLFSQSQNFAEWYNELVLKADLAEYSPVRGCMIIKPYGYAIWENIQKILDAEIKKLEVKNVYFPLFIPENYLKKESEHIKGFSPEVAWVTYGGNKKLQERLAIRPTSETIMYSVFANWIRSYRDLPLKINQWANIVRWEMRPRLFLRTLEFLWQEGHTAHSTEKETDSMAKKVLLMYKNFIQNTLAVYVEDGIKTESEKFAGAKKTLTLEALMKDGRALQMGTSHNLGQNFSKAFKIKFLDRKGKQNYVWQTSWGVSTRLIGGIIMNHGDDKGLILPPKIAPFQVVIVPIWKNSKEKKQVKDYIQKIEEKLKEKNVRCLSDWNKQTPGWKFNEWELKGIPLRLEIGPKEAKKRKITLVPRDILKKEEMTLKSFVENLDKILEDIQKRIFTASKKFTKENTYQVETFSEFKNIISHKGGFIKTFWCGNPKCEKEIKEQTKATIRCIPFNQDRQKGKCIKCGRKSNLKVLFAKAY